MSAAHKIKPLQLWQHFPDSIRAKAQGCFHSLSLKPGQKLLEQNQMNMSLFILLDGSLNVIVDGVTVTLLNEVGRLVGEVSFVTGEECSADIVAENDVTLLQFSSAEFASWSQVDVHLFLQSVYKILTLELTYKLRQANEKAKHFEKLSKQLEQTQAQLNQLHHSIEASQTQKSRRFMATASELYQKYSSYLTTGPLEKLRLGLEELQNEYLSFRKLQSKSVCVIDSQKKNLVLARLALGASGFEVETLSEAKIEDAKNFDLMFCDQTLWTDDLESKSKNRAFVFSTKIAELGDSLDPKILEKGHVLFRNENDRQGSIRHLTVAATKILSEDYFGLEKYLSWGVDVNSVHITGSCQRHEALEQMDSDLQAMGIRSLHRDGLRLVAEELLMNAIYDAPVGGDGKSLYNHLSRQVAVELEPQHFARLRYATDGMILAVSVEDPFGGLKASTLFDYLKSCYGGQAGSLNADKGGAGRGLHQIVENSDLLVLNLRPGKKTEVIAVISLESRELTERTPLIQIFNA